MASKPTAPEAAPADRQRLLRLLHDLRHQDHLATLQGHLEAQERSKAGAADWWVAAQQASQKGDEPLAEQYREFARQERGHAETYRRCAAALLDDLAEAERLLIVAAPDLWGTLPLIDMKTVRTLDPVALAERFRAVLAKLLAAEPVADNGAPAEPSSRKAQLRGKAKTQGENGTVEELWITMLTAHHRYEYGKAENQEPIGVRDMADQSERSLSRAVVSKYFRRHFGDHGQYKGRCRRGLIGADLARLNRETLDPALKPLFDEAFDDQKRQVRRTSRKSADD